MNKNKYLKPFFLLPLMAAIGLLVMSCSKSDEMPESVPEPIELDADSVQVINNLEVKFLLLNKDSLPVTTFKEGENITFKLVITNQRNATALLASYSEILCPDDLFRIYSSTGEDMGLPWDVAVGGGVAVTSLEAGESLFLSCPAFGPEINLETWVHDYTKSRVAFAKTEARQPLPKGSYYTKFKINLRETPLLYEDMKDNYVEIRKEFKIE